MTTDVEAKWSDEANSPSMATGIGWIGSVIQRFVGCFRDSPSTHAWCYIGRREAGRSRQDWPLSRN